MPLVTVSLSTLMPSGREEQQKEAMVGKVQCPPKAAPVGDSSRPSQTCPSWLMAPELAYPNCYRGEQPQAFKFIIELSNTPVKLDHVKFTTNVT